MHSVVKLNNNSEIDAIIPKQCSAKNKAKLSQTEIVYKQYHGGGGFLSF